MPFGGEHAHKAFALALGLQLLVDSLIGDGYGAVMLVAQPAADPVPALRTSGCRLAPSGRRLTSAGLLAQRAEDDRIDPLDSVDTFLEVLRSRPVVEGLAELAVVAEAGEAVAQLCCQSARRRRPSPRGA